MKKIILVMLAALAGYQLWGQYMTPAESNEPQYEMPYVVVYGRDSCGYTQKTLRELLQADIPFDYRIVDDKQVASELHKRMEISGIDTRLYNLPVIDVNNQIAIRPSTEEIIDSYQGSRL